MNSTRWIHTLVNKRVLTCPLSKHAPFLFLTLQHKIQTVRVIQNSEFYIIGLWQIYLFLHLPCLQVFFFYSIFSFITIDKLWSANPDTPPPPTILYIVESYYAYGWTYHINQLILEVSYLVHVGSKTEDTYGSSGYFKLILKLWKIILTPLPTNKIYYS